MNKQIVEFPDGAYAIDWQLLRVIIRSYVNSRLILQNAAPKTEKHWIGPDLHTVEVNWHAVHASVERETDALFERLMRDAWEYGMRSQVANLRTIIAETAESKRCFTKMWKDASQKTQQNIETSVRRGETGEAVARYVRDLSKTTVIIGADVLAGPEAGPAVAMAINAGSAVLDAAVDYQDNRNIGSATVKFAGGFTAGLIVPGGTTGQKYAVAFIKAGVEGFTSASAALIVAESKHEKTPAENLKGAVLDAAVGTAGSFAGFSLGESPAFRKLLYKTAYPVATKIHYQQLKPNPNLSSAMTQKSAAWKFAREASEMSVSNGVETGLKGVSEHGEAAGREGTSRAYRSSQAPAVLIDQDILLNAVAGPNQSYLP